jgi:DNA-binding NarL/FixJ family response regulator
MLVIVADDQPHMLTFVRRWFARKYAADRSMRLETIDTLDRLEPLVASLNQHPFLIFVDLNWHGDKSRALKTISRIKRSKERRCWPILVYSESTDDKDVYDAHYHHANGYVHKGDNQEEQFINVVEHWRAKQRLPSH